MSGKLMARVYEYEFEHGEQSVLLAMADHAQDDGTHIFPSVPYIAWKTCYSERQVQRIIGAMVKCGVLIVVHPSYGQRATEYRMDLSRATPKPPFHRSASDGVSGEDDDEEGFDTGDMVTPVMVSPVTISAIRGDISSTTGDISDGRGDIRVSPRIPIEPSIEPPREPPVRARGRDSPTRNAPLPETFMVTKGMWQWAFEKEMSRDFIKRETEKFVAHFRSTGGLKKNWTMAWYKWLLSAQDGKYQQRRA